MIMIHSSHQALLGQFLSSKTNTRTDEYGGSLENRMRYPFEEIRAIRESVGEKMLFLKCVSADVKRLLADPEMIHNALAGQDEKTRPCIRCQEHAEQLGSEGHNVTIIDMIPTESMSHTVNRASQQEIIVMRFPKYGVRMEENCKIKEFTEYLQNMTVSLWRYHYVQIYLIPIIAAPQNKVNEKDLVSRQSPLNS